MCGSFILYRSIQMLLFIVDIIMNLDLVLENRQCKIRLQLILSAYFSKKIRVYKLSAVIFFPAAFVISLWV